MKPLPLLLLALFSACFLTSCKDTPEKIAEDARDLIEDATDILIAYEEGKISESEAVEDLEKLKEKAKDITARIEELKEKEELKPSDDQFKKMEAIIDPAYDELKKVKKRLGKAGKGTPALKKALNWR